MRLPIAARVFRCLAILALAAVAGRSAIGQVRTIRISESASGEQANGHSDGAFMSDDGRYIAFQSSASNLVPGDTNGKPDVFLRDMQAGTIHRVSLGANGQQLSLDSRLLGLAPDGSKVAFRTAAVDVVSGYFGATERVIVRNLQTGTNQLVNLMSNGQLSGRQLGITVLSSNLRFIVFAEYDPTASTYLYSMWRRDMESGIVRQLPVSYQAGTYEATISDDGRWVAYTNPAGQSSIRTVFLYDSAIENAVQLFSIFGSTPCDSYHSIEMPVLNRDGSKLVFTSNSALVPGLNSGVCRHIFEFDRNAGSVRALAVAPNGVSANGDGLTFGYSVARFGARSADGGTVMFTTTATNLVPQAPGQRGLILKRLSTGANELIDLELDGTDCSITSLPSSVWAPTYGNALSRDARYVVFSTTCDQIVPNDTNNTSDVFLRDRWYPGPVNFCESKPNSHGCLPRMGWQGSPSLGGSDDFHLTASQVRNSSPGIMFWGTGPDRVPFAGGYRCVRGPVIRSGVVQSGGTPYPGTDCSGTYSYHFSHAYMASYLLAPGTSLYAQYWQRDVLHPDGTGQGLTDGLEFTITP